MRSKLELKTFLFAAGISLVLGFGLAQKFRLSKAHLSAPTALPCLLRFKEKGLCASVEWIKPPVAQNEAEFLLKFWDPKAGSANGPFIAPPGDLKVSLWMPGMGHGTEPVMLTRDHRSEGIFRVSRVLFSMRGDWEVWISLLDDDQLIEKAKTTYRL